MTNIYLITNLINNKKYVGKTKYSIEARFEGHCCDLACMSNKKTAIHQAIMKYGRENFKIELLDVVDDNDWKYWENFYIKKYKTYYTEGGYNLTWGGDDNPMDNEVVRQKHFEATHSDQFINLQRKLSTNRKHTLQSREKMSVVQKEIQNRPDIKNKIILNQPHRVKVAIVDDNENIIKEFISLTEAVKFLNKPYYCTMEIHKKADKYNKNGKRATCYGYKWTCNF